MILIAHCYEPEADRKLNSIMMIIHEYLQQSYRIAIDLTPLLETGENGGINLFIDFLIKSLLRLAPDWKIILLTSSTNHHHVTQIYQKQAKTYCIKPNINHFNKILTYSVKLWHILRQVMGWNRVLHQLNVDLLLCPYTNTAYQESGIPTITVVHDLQHLAIPQAFGWRERLYRQMFFQRLSYGASQIICISEFTRQAMLQAFPQSAQRLTVIHHGNYRQELSLNIAEVHQVVDCFGLQFENYLFYPANTWPHKNHKTLLRAYLQYRNQCVAPLDLVLSGAIIGNKLELQDFCQAHDLEPYVHFCGYVDPLSLEALWRGCYCLVFPSRYEGFGMPILEAMFYEKPILSSQAASLPEVGGDAVLYFNPDDVTDLAAKLKKITIEPQLGNELVKKGKQRLRKFSTDDTAQRYLAIMINCLDESNSNNPGL
ncbi:glycosyltransferase family 1 protein [Synechococcus sp. PCC 6312]|uniref:glycosyltransferase family 4 protein n=1 Tax=Synechococcus sp. (strain ATCC 27167 / PCC 6312) TaxID=195253 RepID=UPI00029F1748|nr:glycosyltransferase family 1 protein [Synechococcus sp. PCC 6312]AFY60487.1 glycosyltransferase [Synechococcus sp. PCC 6312]